MTVEEILVIAPQARPSKTERGYFVIQPALKLKVKGTNHLVTVYGLCTAEHQYSPLMAKTSVDRVFVSRLEVP